MSLYRRNRCALRITRFVAVLVVFNMVFAPLGTAYAARATSTVDTTLSTSTQATTDSGSTKTNTGSGSTQKGNSGPIKAPSSQTMSAMSGGEPSSKWVNNYTDNVHMPDSSQISGAFTHDVAIVVPPGRAGMEPHLAISYDSQEKNYDNIFGFGWSINIPYIQRLQKNGVNNLYNQNYFSSTLDGELASTSVTTYGAKFDDGSYRRYTFATSTNTWTMVDKAGVQYTFGSATTSRMYDESTSTTRIFRWVLERVEDTRGNTIVYTYTKDQGQIYPATITYTGNGTSTAPFEVSFVTQSRSDAHSSYTSGFSIITAKRVNEIDVKFNGTLVNKYVFAYTTGYDQSRSLLQSVTQTAYDESGTPTTLPAETFSYQTMDAIWPQYSPAPTSLGDIVDANARDTGYRIFHATTSPGSDLVLSTDCGGVTRSSKQAPDMTDSTASLGSLPALVACADKSDLGVAFGDVDGNGFADVIRGKAGSYNEVWFHPYTAASTTLTNIPSIVDSTGKDRGIRLGDFNGDGYVDYLYGPSGTSTRMYLNNANGTGWTDAGLTDTVLAFIDGSNYDTGARVMDLNGDGIDDVVKYKTGDTSPTIYTNHGDGLRWNTATSGITGVPAIIGTSGADQGVRIIDINADGLLDFVVSTPALGIHAYINAGDGKTFADRPINTIPYFLDANGNDIGTRVIEANSSGVPSFVTSNPSTKIEYVSQGHVTDLLTTVTLAQGGSISASYQGTHVSSSNVQTVRTITRNPGAGGMVATTTYSYIGGTYYTPYQNRKFAGFAEVDTTDGAGNVSRTYYHQGNGDVGGQASKGEYNDTEAKMYRPYRIEQYTGSTTLMSVAVTKWDSKDLGNGRTLVYDARDTALTYEGGSSHRDSATTYDYATSTGNLIEKKSWGEVTASTDGSFTDTGTDVYTATLTYASSTGSHVTGLPSTETTIDQSSNKIKEAKHYYDNQALGAISLGNETKTEQWISGSSYASSTKSYNSFGLVTSSTDPRGNATTYTYDSYALYPATTTNALSQSATYLYNYRIGKAKQTKDANGLIFQTTYDGLGRIVEEKQPDLTTPSTLVTKAAYTYGDSGLPRSIQKTTHLDGSLTHTDYTYLDGFGRTIQTRAQTENANTYTTKDTVYDSRGLVWIESLPYFATGSSWSQSYNLNPSVNAQVLVVGGGGGGGAGQMSNNNGGGGGAGGFIYNSSYAITGGSYTVIVGGGGVGATSINVKGSNGGNSAFDTLYAIGGGGGGGNIAPNNAQVGGSGGGGSMQRSGAAGTTGQGTVGGNGGTSSGGGGGGASVAGSNGSGTNGGNGGNGTASSIRGSSVIYAGGGGGAGAAGSYGAGGNGGGGHGANYAANATSGSANTGGGGGAGSAYNEANQWGANGGSGIVIISAPQGNISATGGTHTTAGGNDIWTFATTGITSFVASLTASGEVNIPSHLRTTYTYDALKRPLTIAHAVGTTTNAYTPWKVSTTDPRGNAKDYSKDSYNNLVQVDEHTASSTYTTVYTYDGVGNLTKITDALGNIRNFTYDGRSQRLTAEDLHVSGAGTFGTYSYTYDAAGNLTQKIDPKSQTVNYTYDVLNRIATEDYTGATSTEVTYTYDSCTYGVGRLCTASSTAARTTYTYNALGGKSSEALTLLGATTTYTTSYTYNRQGSMLTVTNPNGAQITYTYNATGLTSGVSRTPQGGNATSLATLSNYTPTNALGSILFGSGAVSTYTYDTNALYRLTRIWTSGAATATPPSVHVLVVGGGGGGGSGEISNNNGGGGGAGGFVDNTAYPVGVGTHAVTVGSGGTGATTINTKGGNGGDSIFGTLTAVGGGGGGGNIAPNGAQAGGSGGGGSMQRSGAASTTGQGSVGGNGGSSSGGGGGGAGVAGSNGSGTSGGSGGAGTASSINGSSVTYAGGGGGAGADGSYGAGGNGGGGHGANYAANATAGSANTGGGGGAGSAYSGANQWGANGGSGIVIISAPIGTITATGGTHTTYGGNDIWTFTSSGSFVVTAATSTATASTTLQDLNYTYDATGNILTRIDNSTQVGGQTVTYTYDALNRLSSASTTGASATTTPSYNQTFTYNALGNLLTGPGGEYTYANTGNANPHAVTQTNLTVGNSAPTIAFDNSTLSGNGVNASSLTFSHTTNAATTSSTLIVVGVQESTTGSCTSDTVTSALYNGTNLTDLGYYTRSTTNGTALKTYYGYAPAQGAHNVVVSSSASCIRYVVATTYRGVKQSGMPDASGTGNPLSDSGAVSALYGTTTVGYNAWPVMIGVPATTTALLHNLISYWKLDGNSTDAQGSHSGTDSAITYSAGNGKLTQGAGFNGSTSHIAIPVDGSWNLGNSNFTLSAWARKDGTMAQGGNLIYFTDSSLQSRYYMDMSNSGLVAGQFYDGTNGAFARASSTNPAAWNHYVFMRTGGTASLYINGTLANSGENLYGTSADTYISNISEARMGAERINSGWFNGALDEVGVWSRALSQGEITQLYNGGNGLTHASFTPALTASSTANTTIRQQQTADLVYADSNGPRGSGAQSLGWTTATSTHWSANYFSLPPTVSNPGTTYTTDYTYDANGNLTGTQMGATSTTYTYDYANRLITSAGTGKQTTNYTYDQAGNRLTQYTSTTTTIYPSRYYSITQTSVGTTTYATSTEYVFAGETLLATIDQAYTNGTTTGTSTVRYVHVDHLGSVNAVSDQAGGLVQYLDYYPYGAVRSNVMTGEADSKRKYVNRFADQSTLDYFNARYYDPNRGQFTSEDPVFWSLKQNLNNPQSLNSYSYANGNPITMSDPDGLAATEAQQIAVLKAQINILQGIIGLYKGGYTTQANSAFAAYQTAFGGGTSQTSGTPSGQRSTTPVPNATACYPNVTPIITSSLNSKMLEHSFDPKIDSLDYFYKKVRNGGEWDLKNTDEFNHNTYPSGFAYSGKIIRNDAPGNIHFGYVGAAAGFSPTTLLTGAGAAQVVAGTSEWKWVNTNFHGDDPVDQVNILWGINMYYNR